MEQKMGEGGKREFWRKKDWVSKERMPAAASSLVYENLYKYLDDRKQSQNTEFEIPN